MRRIIAMAVLIIVLVVVVTVPFIILGEQRFASFSHQETGITTFLLTTLELVGIISSIALVVFILYLNIRDRRQHQFVFEDFSNESVLLNNENKPLNLSMLAREELARQLKSIYKELSGHSFYTSQYSESLVADELYSEENSIGNALGIHDYSSLLPLQNDFVSNPFGINQDYAEFLKIDNYVNIVEGFNLLDNYRPINWDDVAPKEIMPIIKVIQALIPPQVIKATGYLQWWTDMPGRVGITFELVDLGSQSNLMSRTIKWQPSDNIEDSDSVDTQQPAQSDATNDTVTIKAADNFIELLRPAMYWLAMTFWGQNLISHVPLINRILKVREKRRRARILYLLGALFFVHADQIRAYKSFFRQLAVEHFRQASVTDSIWPLPYLSLANLYSFKMIETTGERKRDIREKLLDEALRLYEEALICAERTNASIYTQQRIKLSRALAELNSDNDELVKKAKKEVQDIKVSEGPVSPENFDPKREDCAAYLYNLARWYELSLELCAGVPNAVVEARRYLAYSLARSQSLWDSRYLNKHFKLLHEDGDLEVLKEELGKKLREKPELEVLTGEKFKIEIDEILKMVDQKLLRY